MVYVTPRIINAHLPSYPPCEEGYGRHHRINIELFYKSFEPYGSYFKQIPLTQCRSFVGVGNPSFLKT